MSFRSARVLWPAVLVIAMSVFQVAAQLGSEEFQQEEGPELTIQECTKSGCKEKKTKVTMDANWRWVHKEGESKNCYDGDKWIPEYCPEGKEGARTCAETCAIEGVDKEGYKVTYGIEEIENGLSMKFVNKHEHGTSVGGRVYVLDGDDKYYLWKLRNREFAFTADISEIDCGMNGAVYFVEMDEKGDQGEGANQAGAKFGTGYCDAQCPHDIKFIKGDANSYEWKPNPKDSSGNMGIGHWGACCQEMDIWEANAHAQAYTPHPCKDAPHGGNSMVGLFRCEGTDCGDNDKDERYKGVCDKDGCDFNAWRMGDKTFYGRGSEFTLDTSKPMTLVTQFFTHDGTDDGELTEIRRVWVQDGKVVANAISKNFDPWPNSNTITEQMCEDAMTSYGDINHFRHLGGLKEMGDSIARGHVLAISLWDDIEVSMMWLDSDFPRDKDPSMPGISRGPCPGGEQSTPTYVREKFPEATHRYTDFKIGEIGTTTTGVLGGDPAPTTLHDEIEIRPKPATTTKTTTTAPKLGKPSRRRRSTRRRSKRRRSSRRRSKRRRSSRRRSRRRRRRRRSKPAPSPPSRPSPPKNKCSIAGDDCTDTKCCATPGWTCYEKNPYWSSCKDSCTPGIDPNDAPEYQDPWSCKVLGGGTSGPSPPSPPTKECSIPGDNCMDTKCCATPGWKCYQKNPWWSSCRDSCTPGIDPNDAPEYQDPWSCKVLS